MGSLMMSNFAAQGAVPVTPSDAALVGPFREIYVGTSGDLTIYGLDAVGPVTFKNCPVGTLRVGATRIMATGTTATNIVGLV